MSRVLKISVDGRMHRRSLEEPVSFKALMKAARQCVGHDEFSLAYVDDEGDNIALSNKHELAEMLEVFPSGTLRLVASVSSSAPPASVSASSPAPSVVPPAVSAVSEDDETTKENDAGDALPSELQEFFAKIIRLATSQGIMLFMQHHAAFKDVLAVGKQAVPQGADASDPVSLSNAIVTVFDAVQAPLREIILTIAAAQDSTTGDLLRDIAATMDVIRAHAGLVATLLQPLFERSGDPISKGLQLLALLRGFEPASSAANPSVPCMPFGGMPFMPFGGPSQAGMPFGCLPPFGPFGGPPPPPPPFMPFGGPAPRHPTRASSSNEGAATSDEPATHTNVECDGCGANPIVGHRYKCSVCRDYDLCATCEGNDVHSEHPMLVIKRPTQAPAAIFTVLYDDDGNEMSGSHSSADSCHNWRRAQRCRRNRFGGKPWGHGRRCRRQQQQQQEAEAQAAANEDPELQAALERSLAEVGQPQLRAKFVSAKPKKHFVAPNESFVKTWNLFNDGDIAWPTGTRCVFAGGDDLNASESHVPVECVVPGNSTSVSVSFTAPADQGRFTSYWRLEDAEGNRFGQRMWADVFVEGTASTESVSKTDEHDDEVPVASATEVAAVSEESVVAAVQDVTTQEANEAVEAVVEATEPVEAAVVAETLTQHTEQCDVLVGMGFDPAAAAAALNAVGGSTEAALERLVSDQ